MAELTVDNQGDDRAFGEITERLPDETTESTESPKETTEEKTETQTEEETTEGGEEGAEAEGETPKDEETSTDGETGEEDKPKLTEKGTKLDPNPLSAAHQELANERRKSEQMARILSNPRMLSEYMKNQFGNGAAPQGDSKPEPKVEAKKYTSEDFENLEDVAKVVNELQSNFSGKTEQYEKKIEELSTTVNNLLQGGRANQVATSVNQDIATLQAEKELDPKSSDFVEGLEDRISNAYHKLDYDETTGGYRGNYRLADIGRDMIEAVRMGRKAGSQKTQTIVKNKTQGKVVTSPKVETEVTTDDMKPEDSIAAGISKTFR